MENNTEESVAPSWKESTLGQKIAKVIFVLVSSSMLVLGGFMVLCGGVIFFDLNYGLWESLFTFVTPGIGLIIGFIYLLKRVIMKKNLTPGKSWLILFGIILGIFLLFTFMFFLFTK